jgi:hypothetical protein
MAAAGRPRCADGLLCTTRRSPPPTGGRPRRGWALGSGDGGMQFNGDEVVHHIASSGYDARHKKYDHHRQGRSHDRPRHGSSSDAAPSDAVPCDLSANHSLGVASVDGPVREAVRGGPVLSSQGLRDHHNSRERSENHLQGRQRLQPVGVPLERQAQFPCSATTVIKLPCVAPLSPKPRVGTR